MKQYPHAILPALPPPTNREIRFDSANRQARQLIDIIIAGGPEDGWSFLKYRIDHSDIFALMEAYALQPALSLHRKVVSVISAINRKYSELAAAEREKSEKKK